MAVRIPKGTADTPGPCWLPVPGARPTRPIIKCRCGELVTTGLTWAERDGVVTASFYHARGERPCGWHDFLILDDWEAKDEP